MPGGRRKWIRANIGTFLQQYQRKAQLGVEPNDRHYDRDLEAGRGDYPAGISVSARPYRARRQRLQRERHRVVPAGRFGRLG